MTSPTDLDREFEERARVLDAWSERQRRIAILQAESTELLIDRIELFERDLVDNGHHRDAIFR